MAILQLCLCFVTVVELTSSQSTYDVIQPENDFSSCDVSDQVLSELSQIQTAISQLQSDVSELKTCRQSDLTGIPLFALFFNTTPH